MLGVWSCWLAGMDPRWILICIEVLSFGMVWSFFAWFQGLNSLKWRGVCVLLTVAHFCIMAIRVEQPFLITENFRIIHHQNSSRSEKHHVATYEEKSFLLGSQWRQNNCMDKDWVPTGSMQRSN